MPILLAIIIFLPIFASAATSPGIKPGSFFYFFDTAFEKVGMFFAFGPEKKAEKALKYADERLAEAEAVTDNADAVKTAVENYENSIAFAEEKSKAVGDKEKAEALLTSIADNTSKHQEVLTDVLAKVPEEAKEAIAKAIEAGRRGQEEALRKIAELQGEVEKLKHGLAELKARDEEREKIIEESNRPKSEIIKSVKQTPPQISETIITPEPTTIQTTISVSQTQSTTAIGEKLDYTKTKYIVASYSKKVGDRTFVCAIESDAKQLIMKTQPLEYTKWGCGGLTSLPTLIPDQQDKVSFTIQVLNIDREGIGHKKVFVTASSEEINKELTTDEYGIARFDFSTGTPGSGYITLRTDDGFARDIEFYATKPTPLPIRTDPEPATCTEESTQKAIADRNEHDLVWWYTPNQYYALYYQSFTVSQSGTTISANIPWEMKNEKNYPLTYTLLYWIADTPNANAKANAKLVPFSFEIAPEYLNHKVAFQMFVNYDCWKYIQGGNTPGIKAERNSVITLDLK